MIPIAYLREWSAHAPWPSLRQVEQDLITCRALCDLFNSHALKGKIAFRGGTAIHKLLFDRPLRYSEDIDLVQMKSEPIGQFVDSVRDALSWLGPCRRSQAAHSMHLRFRFQPEDDASATLNLKIEINTCEHEPLYGIKGYTFRIDSSWYTAETTIASFEAEELFATKLRALLQRNKGRDLFDLNEGLNRLTLDTAKVVAGFEHYLGLQGTAINRARAEEIMLRRLRRSLTEDIVPLLSPGVVFTDDEAIAAFGRIWNQLIGRIGGDPWQSSQRMFDELRKTNPKILGGESE